jgi:type IV fimbrial biogenesis protein FimT
MELMKTLASAKKSHSKNASPMKQLTNNRYTQKKSTSPFNKINKKPLGFTLINLLIALTVTSVLASSGISAIAQIYYYHRASSSYNELFTLIQFTRIQAVNYHSQVILCPTTDHINCINDWNQTLMVFVDTNDDKTNDASEELLRIKTKLNKDEIIRWDVGAVGRNYLRFEADGSTSYQNGRLSYCLTKNEELYATQIVMYRTGRARRGSDQKAVEKCNL